MDWNNVDLNSPSESGSCLVDPYTFDALLLEIECNLPEINLITVREQAMNSIQSRYEEAIDILTSNLINITNHALKERAKKMRPIYEIKEERQAKTSEAIKACGMFFAFSDKQWEENKTPLQEGDKYVSLGMGAYMPKSQVEKWNQMTEEVDVWFKEQISSPEMRTAYISYELSNHEAWYTGEIDDTLSALGEGYTHDEVYAVFRAGYAEHTADL